MIASKQPFIATTEVACPSCGAKPGQRCTTKYGAYSKEVHLGPRRSTPGKARGRFTDSATSEGVVA